MFSMRSFCDIGVTAGGFGILGVTSVGGGTSVVLVGCAISDAQQVRATRRRREEMRTLDATMPKFLLPWRAAPPLLGLGP